MAPCDAMEPASSRLPIEKTLLVVWCDEPVTHRANARRRPAERRGVTMRSASRAVAQIAGAVTVPFTAASPALVATAHSNRVPAQLPPSTVYSRVSSS